MWSFGSNPWNLVGFPSVRSALLSSSDFPTGVDLRMRFGTSAVRRLRSFCMRSSSGSNSFISALSFFAFSMLSLPSFFCSARSVSDFWRRSRRCLSSSTMLAMSTGKFFFFALSVTSFWFSMMNLRSNICV